jgi:predicted RNA-binding protein associated with RNAse of E/G family
MRRCIERKRYLCGDEVIFECELVTLEERFGILKYVIHRQWQVDDLALRPGTVTYAFYWVDRPYNLYWWVDQDGRTVGYYFNLADSVELSAHEFVWRDLVIDILILPASRGETGQRQVQIIDEDGLPDTLSGALRAYIEAGKCQVLQNYATIIEEVSLILDEHLHFS